MYLSIHPLLSIIYSLLLINGIYFLSKVVAKFSSIIFLRNYFNNTNFIIFFFIINFIMFLIYPIVLFLGVNKLYLQIFCFCIMILGFGNINNIEILRFKKIKKKSLTLSILIILIFSYFLISLMPVTDPDSLEYHLTVPFLSLESGSFYLTKTWMHGQLVGAGEALITLAMSINSYQIMPIMQFLSLYLIVYIIINSKLEKYKTLNESKYLVAICILSIPALLFLTLSSKPQLIGVANNFLAFYMVVFVLPNEKNIKKSIFLFSSIIFLTFISTQIKFSFFLSSGIITLFAIYEMYVKKIFTYTILIIILSFLIIIFPREYYEFIYLNPNYITNFFQPVSDPMIADNLIASLKHGPGYSKLFPTWIIIPRYLGEVSYVIGPTILIFLVNLNFKIIEVKKLVIASIIYFAIGLPFGQPVGRFFLEPAIWIIFASLLYIERKNNLLFSIFRYSVLLQSILIIFILNFSIFNFSSALISKENFKNILNKYADGYQIYEWSNDILPENSVLISTHRSLLLSKHKTLSTDFRLFVRNKAERKYFIDLIAKSKPTHILYVESELNNPSDIFKSCRGNLFAFKKDIGKINVRNPLNNNVKYYDGYIYEIDQNKLSYCYK